MTTSLDKELTVAEAAARAAGKHIMTFWNQDVEMEYKGEVDLVSHVDRGAEQIILSHLHDAFPADCIVGEEEREQWEREECGERGK